MLALGVCGTDREIVGGERPRPGGKRRSASATNRSQVLRRGEKGSGFESGT